MPFTELPCGVSSLQSHFIFGWSEAENRESEGKKWLQLRSLVAAIKRFVVQF